MSHLVKLFFVLLTTIVICDSSKAALTTDEFDDFAHLSMGADVFPYDWWIRLKSNRLKTLTGEYLPIQTDLEKRTSAILDPNPNSKYISGVVGLSATWSGHGAMNPEALRSDPEMELTKLVQKAPVRYVTEDEIRVPSIRMMGTTCSACHTYNLKTPSGDMIIPGSPANLSLEWLLGDMIESTFSLFVNVGDQLTDFLVSFGYERSEAAKLANEFKKETIRNTEAATKRAFVAKALHLRKRIPGYKLIVEESNIADRLKSLLRLTLHMEKDAPLGNELNKRMEFIAKLAVGTPKKTFQDGQWIKFHGVNSGYGRVDAFIGAFNNVLRNPNERINIISPIGFPPLWGIQNKYLLHYTGNTNSVTYRNIGLAVAAGSLFLNDETNEATVKIENLFKIENILYKMDIPNWRKTFKDMTLSEFKIDEVKTLRGKEIFRNNCAGCHSPEKTITFDSKNNKFINPLYQHRLGNQNKIGTDPNLAVQIVKPISPLTDQKSYPAKIYSNRIRDVAEAYFKKYNISKEEQERLMFTKYRGEQFFKDVKIEKPDSSYLARDLSGVWSTAPFLHNDSVPTLWDLLLKPQDRPKKFVVKSRSFDPVTVGLKDYREGIENCEPRELKKKKADIHLCLDTTAEGNSNAGHDFGTNLTDSEKFDLIEYLKVIPSYASTRTPADDGSEEKRMATPFLDELDQLKLGKLPIIGDMLEQKDYFKHRLLAFKKWLSDKPDQKLEGLRSLKPVDEMFAELREFRPVALLSKLPVFHFNDNNDGLVLVSRYEDVVDVMNNPAVFSVRHVGYKLDPLGGHMLGTDLTPFNEIEKPWLRKLITAADYPYIQNLIKKLVKESFDKIEKEQVGSATFKMNAVDDLGKRVPSLLFQQYFGFSSASLDQLYDWSHWIQYDTFGNQINLPWVRGKAVKKEKDLLKLMLVHIDKVEQELLRNGSKENYTVLEKMLLSDEYKKGVTTRDGKFFRITKERIAINMIGLVGASIDTIQIALMRIINFFQENPDLKQLAIKVAMSDDLETMQKFVLEALRLKPPGPVLIRYAEQDAVIGHGEFATHIPQGTSILVGIRSAMRDPSHVKNPEEFNIDRPEDNYFSFGYGYHKCAGDRLGQVELAYMMMEILKKDIKSFTDQDSKKAVFPEKRILEYTNIQTKNE